MYRERERKSERDTECVCVCAYYNMCHLFDRYLAGEKDVIECGRTLVPKE